MTFEAGHKKLGGRKKGQKKKYTREVIEAIFKKAEKKHDGVSILEHLCNLAYEDNAIAIAMLRKLVPDLRSLELQIDTDDVNSPAKHAETLLMMERATDGSASAMGQLKDLLCQIKVGVVIDEKFVAELEPMMVFLAEYRNGGLVVPQI